MIEDTLLLYRERWEEGGVRSYNYNYVIDYDSVLPTLSLMQLQTSLVSNWVKTIIGNNRYFYQQYLFFCLLSWFKNIIKNQDIWSVTLIKPSLLCNLKLSSNREQESWKFYRILSCWINLKILFQFEFYLANINLFVWPSLPNSHCGLDWGRTDKFSDISQSHSWATTFLSIKTSKKTWKESVFCIDFNIRLQTQN